MEGLPPNDQTVNQESDEERRFSKFSAAIHSAIGFFIVALLTLLQVKYEDNRNSPFEKHRPMILLFIVAASIYTGSLVSVAIVIRNQLNTNYLAILRHASIIFGTVACDSLLFMLSPLLGYLVLALCVLLIVKSLLESYQQILHFLYHAAQIASEAGARLHNWLDYVFKLIFQHGSNQQQGENGESSAQLPSSV